MSYLCGKSAPTAPGGRCTRPVSVPGGECGIDHATGLPRRSTAAVGVLRQQAQVVAGKATLDVARVSSYVNKSVSVETRSGGYIGTLVYGDEYGVTVETVDGFQEAFADDILNIEMIGV